MPFLDCPTGSGNDERKRGPGDFSPDGVIGVSPSLPKSPPKYGGLTGGLDDIIIELASRSYTGLDIK